MKTQKMILSIILSLLALVVAQILSQLIASIVMLVKIPSFVANILAGFLYVGFAYLLIKLLCKKYIKGDMSDYNIPIFKIELKWGIVAVLLPIIITVFYILFIPGSFEQNALDIDSKLELLSAGIFFTGFGAGFVEELVFRGVIMSVIEKRFSKKIAIIVPSVLFGLVHIIGMGFNLLSCILVLLAGTMVGIMFSLIASETNSIWNSAIVHAFWNIIIIGGILQVGSEFDEYSLFSYVLDVKSFLLTGGEFGIESSIIAVMGYGLICLLAVLSNKKKNERT
ncbi:MAG: CPBP family intramembrane metalloprotease [Lachnospiraceae bacterium]|nr:CPBP family intramembrane metalloprotease [Lachnospiraceae bacterium]MBQ8326757.1 CPBP family intramembrane metalloprotease [Lachnospiraceae bacterium]